MKKERNYWPHAIVGIILSVVIAGAWTVKIALENPVQEDTYFIDKYQYVDTNINTLLEKKAKFDAKYSVMCKTDRFDIGKNSLLLKIVDKDGNSKINNAKIELLITRPDTNKYNQNIKPNKIDNGIYYYGEIDIPKIGRWQILAKTKIGDLEGFDKFEVNATR